MSALDDIIERRARLIAEAELQRKSLGAELAVCRSVLVVVDRGITWAKWLRARPYLVVAAVTAIAVLKPRFALAWSARIVTLWRAGRFLYEAIRPALTSHGSARGPAGG
jgi:YqjK-like protein